MAERVEIPRAIAAIQDLVADFDQVNFTQPALGLTSTVILVPNPNRWLVMFQLFAGTGGINIRPMAGGTDGIVLTSNAAPTIFLFRDHAVLCTSGWNGRSTGAGSLNCWEVLYKPRR